MYSYISTYIMYMIGIVCKHANRVTHQTLPFSHTLEMFFITYIQHILIQSNYFIVVGRLSVIHTQLSTRHNTYNLCSKQST